MIPEGDSMVLTGGVDNWKNVTHYYNWTLSGVDSTDQPQLNDGRSSHGCSSFMHDDTKVCINI